MLGANPATRALLMPEQISTPEMQAVERRLDWLPATLNMAAAQTNGVAPLFRDDLPESVREFHDCRRCPARSSVAARAQKDTRFAKVLDVLLTAPTTPQGTLERIAARTLSDQRRAALVEDFVGGAMRTPEVQALLKLRTPQAVHRLRSRGKLIGSAVGNQTWFPAWQFAMVAGCA